MKVFDAWPPQQADAKETDAELQSGRVDFMNILKDPRLRIAAPCFQERLVLDVVLCAILIKFGLFLAYCSFFFCVLQSIFPTCQASAVGRQAESLFGATRIDTVKSHETLLSFAASLSQRLEKYRPTSNSYWCQAPFLSVEWDHSTGGPKRVCKSPHLLALGHEHAIPWVSGRRLAGANDDNDTTTTSTTTSLLCADRDAQLALSLNDENATCNDLRSTICKLDVGLLYCSSTCGFCPPFRYNRLAEFIGPIVALTPLVVSQTRFRARDCDDWIKGRAAEVASARASFASSPSSAATHGASIGACVDRDEHQNTRYAFNVVCPSDAGEPCSGSAASFGDTLGRAFRGETVYAQMMSRPDVDLEKMRALEWLDRFTDKVMLSALLYTESLQVYTYFALEFSWEVAGNVEWKITTRNAKEWSDSEKESFTLYVVYLFFFVFLGLAETVYTAMAGFLLPRGFHIFELCTRGFLFCASVALTIFGADEKGQTMTNKFKDALVAFLSITNPSEEADTQRVIDRFFRTADSLFDHGDVHNCLGLFCFLVAILQLVQLAVYFHLAHPKAAVVSRAVWQTLSGLLHLTLLLLLMFVLLAFVLHWMFGSSLEESETFGQAMMSQLRIVSGEYIYLPGASGLDGDTVSMYWIYAVCVLVTIFFFIRFVILAMLVNSFTEQKSVAVMCSQSFACDALDILLLPVRSAKNKWPRQRELLQWLKRLAENEDLIRPKQLQDFFGVDSLDALPLATYMCYMYARCPQAYCLLPNGANEADGQIPKSNEISIPEVTTLGKNLEPLNQASASAEEMDVQRVAQLVAHRVTAEMARSEKVNWLSMTGKVTSTLYREFGAHGLIVANR